MRVIIAGSRGATDTLIELESAIRKCGWKISTVLSGTAKGADRLGERWARKNNIKIERYPADWDKHGKQAGYIRNELMSQKADALIALWDCKSRGTADMIGRMRAKGRPVHVEEIL